MKKLLYIAPLICLATACSDDDSFSTSPRHLLTFEKDTLSLDTIFSTIPSPNRQAMVFNNSGDGIRISDVRLESGSRSPFRVNVNGTYITSSPNDPVDNLELRNGDSLRVFVEVTTRNNGDTLPKLISDNLVFTLESNVVQKLALNVWSWDADLLRKARFSKDTTLTSYHGRPIVIYDTLTVDSGVTLTVAPATTLFFHDGAGMNVKGTLKLNGEKDSEVMLRSDRLDRMVSNLTYDNNPGQWGGIRFAKSSFGNEIHFTDIHSGTNAILCDSSSTDAPKLTIDHTTIHNMEGYGIMAQNCDIKMENTVVSNARRGCLAFVGGKIDINHSTIAQYYPFDANRGAALYFAHHADTTSYPLQMSVRNSIIKGYADDVISWTENKEGDTLRAEFSNSILRTFTDKDYEYMFKDCTLEDPTDTLLQGSNYFELFDTDNFFYDFTPKRTLGSTETINPAIGYANSETTLPDDRNGLPRRKDEKHDAGAYETEEP